jgi:hypothetical protein
MTALGRARATALATSVITGWPEVEPECPNLAVGGPLIDDGYDVALIDGEFGPMPVADLVAAIRGHAPPDAAR